MMTGICSKLAGVYLRPGVYFTGENKSEHRQHGDILIIKVKLLMKSLKTIRMIKFLNCKMILCAAEFLKHHKMVHTIIVAVKKIEQRIK